jgi:hypothetical protein
MVRATVEWWTPNFSAIDRVLCFRFHDEFSHFGFAEIAPGGLVVAYPLDGIDHLQRLVNNWNAKLTAQRLAIVAVDDVAVLVDRDRIPQAMAGEALAQGRAFLLRQLALDVFIFFHD